MREFLFLFIPVIMLWGLYAHESEMSDCRGGYVLYFKSNAPLELCCLTDYPDCVEDPSLLTINRVSADLNQEFDLAHMSSSNNTTSSVKLTIPNPHGINDNGMYKCVCNGSIIVKGFVFLIENADAPTLLSITSTFKRDLTVTFDPGETLKAYHDRYIVKADVQGEPGSQEIVLCEMQDDDCKGNCTCTKTMQEIPLESNVTIIVIKDRANRSSEARMTVNLLQHIKPEPVDEMDIENVDSTSASLALCAPFRQISQSFIPKINSCNSFLRLLVTVVKTQGYYEERKFNITLKTSQVCLRIGLSQLTPFTRYKVSVTASGGGGESLPNDAYFTTLEAAPLSSPEDIVYWMVQEKLANQHQGSIQQTYSININWKPLPHDKKAGDISYTVCVSYKLDQNEINFNQTTNKPYFILRKIPDTPVTLNIYSKNKMGLSKSSSPIRIPEGSVHADIDMIPSHVETAGNGAGIYLGKPSPSVEISAIYWCPGKQNSSFPEQDEFECLEYPETVFRGADLEDGKDMLSADVSLKKESCHMETMSDFREEKFYFYDDLTDEKRKSREEGNVHTSRVFANDNNLCPSSSHNDDLIKDQDQHKFMFSIKGSHRLFPFKCYYDNDTDWVSLKFSKMKNERTLMWSQRCDFDSPRQFLVKEYRVFPSQDDSCSDLSGEVTKVENKIIKPSQFKMSPMGVYACVESIKSEHFVSKAISQKMDDLNAGGEDDGDVVPMHTLVVIVIAVVIGIVFVICCCGIRRRRNKARQAFLILRPDPREHSGKDPNHQKTTDVDKLENSDEDSGLASQPPSDVFNLDESATSSHTFFKGSGGNQLYDVSGYYGSDKSTGKHSNSSPETSAHSIILNVESEFHSSEGSTDDSASGSNWDPGSNDMSEQRRQMNERKRQLFMSDSDS